MRIANTIFQKWPFFAGAALAVIIFAEMWVLTGSQDFGVKSNLFSIKSGSLEDYAEKVIDFCLKERYRPACYDEEVPKLLDFLSMEDAFKVVGLIQERDSSYQYCHVLGHNLSAREVSKDQSKWKEVVTRCPSGLCSNGCIHGGFQERFRAESFTDEQIEDIKSDLKDLCEKRKNWTPTGLEQASCYHAVGHLTMYLTDANIEKSTALCEEVARKEDGKDYAQLCFDGVFMQIFQPLEPEDFTLVKGKQPKKADIPFWCEKYGGKKRASCLSESWPLFIEELQEPQGLVEFCSMTDSKERLRCYNALFYVLAVQFNFDSERLIPYCEELPDNLRGRCFANFASRMIQTDYRNIHKAVMLCAAGGAYDTMDECFQELLQYSTYNFHPGSKEFFELCGELPDPWNKICNAKQET